MRRALSSTVAAMALVACGHSVQTPEKRTTTEEALRLTYACHISLVQEQWTCDYDWCRFAASWDQRGGVFCRVMGPPLLQAEGTTREGGVTKFSQPHGTRPFAG